MAAPCGSANPAPSRRTGRRLLFEGLEPRMLLAVTTFSPVADTYTLAGVGAGSAEVLDVLDANGPGDRMAYIRFDLAGVDLSGIETATLTLHKLPGSRDDVIVTDRFDVYGLTSAAGNTPQNWDEVTLAEGNLGAEYTNTAGDGLDTSQLFNLDQESGANIYESVLSAFGAPQSITGPDLLTFLNDRVDDNGLVTFITLVDAGAVRGWGYGSRENADVDLRPILELDDGEPIPDPYPENPTVFPRQMERLDRGMVAVRSSTSQVYVGWRMLGNDPTDVAFNLYRSANGGPAVRLNGAPLTQTTDFVDTTANLAAANEYFVRPVIAGVEQDPSKSYTLLASAPVQQYLNVPLQRPPGGPIQFPAGSLTPPSSTDIDPATQEPYGSKGGQDQFTITYNANDASVGDLDGDGQYEIILKWDPSNSSPAGFNEFTGNTIFDAYTLDGTHLWRIDLGRNVRSAPAFTSFLVYDFDGDGRSEFVVRTAPGTIDGQGNHVILPGDDPSADYRDPYTGVGDGFGLILTGPEYLTVFDGLTGAELQTVNFEPARGDVADWGDNYGHRSDTFKYAVAYLDGERPSLVMGRGIYHGWTGYSSKTEIVAWDWRDGQLTQRWTFTATEGTGDDVNREYVGQGNHNLSVGDVDGDGKDEIVWGAMSVDDDGTGLYSTGLGHGDAMHMSDMDPTNPGLEVFNVHEGPTEYGPNGAEFRDAMTGEVLFGIPATNDVGRGVAFDVDPNYLGYEMWATTSGVVPRMVYNTEGDPIYAVNNISMNFGVWWDADPLRELLDSPDTAPPTITKWQYDAATPFAQTIFAPSGVLTNNGTKATPALSADLLGDWREEVMLRTSDNSALRIYTTTIPATSRMFTLMHDAQYRVAVAWQNVYYNQPPHPSFYLGHGMDTPLQPSIYVPGDLPGDYNVNGVVDAADYSVWRDNLGGSTLLPNDTTPGTVTEADYNVWKMNFGATGPTAGHGAAGASPTTSIVGAHSVEMVAWDAAADDGAAQLNARATETATSDVRSLSAVRLTTTPSAAANRFGPQIFVANRGSVTESRAIRDLLLLAERGPSRDQVSEASPGALDTVVDGNASRSDGEWSNLVDRAFADGDKGTVPFFLADSEKLGQSPTVHRYS